MARDVIEINQDMTAQILIAQDPTSSDEEKKEARKKIKKLNSELRTWFSNNT